MRVLQIFVLVSWALLATAGSKKGPVRCQTEDLLVLNNEDVPKLLERFEGKPLCNVLYGHVLIANLKNIHFPIEIFSKLHHVVNGSIALINNTNVFPRFHFPNMRSVLSQDLPSVMLINNTDITFSVGDHFSKARTRYNISYGVIGNTNPVIDSSTYNQLYIASYPRSRFMLDSHLSVEPCQDSVYKPLAAVMGFLFVTLAVAFSTVAFYDRNNFE